MFWPFGVSSFSSKLNYAEDIQKLVWGLTMAAHRTGISLEEYAVNIGKSFVCAFLLRSSACTVNDIFDREMDAGVGEFLQHFGHCQNSDSVSARCKVRPLPSGRISVRAATAYLMVQYLLGIAWFRATIANGPM